MASPKSKISRSRRGMRRAHTGLNEPTVSKCPTTGKFHLPHRAVKGEDGAYYYKGQQISAPRSQADKE